ncbi:MAG TPA: hypothetical protein PK156_18880, partial [Polyangium sp.]|nr:hypothetical protein [Polyangium sp.]
MALYSTFLARIPPGSPRKKDWTERARNFSCPGFFFGDYDLHGLVRIEGDLSLEHTAKLLRLAADHRMVLLASVPRESESTEGPSSAASPVRKDLVEQWPALCEKYPLFCYFEIGLEQDVLLNTGATLAQATRFVRERLDRVPGSGAEINDGPASVKAFLAGGKKRNESENDRIF